jgi:hypothetical protein
MKPRLLPILFAALLTSCHEKRVPRPELLRFQISAGGGLTNNDSEPDRVAAFIDWLSMEIESGRVDRDVRLDFARQVPVWRMIEMTNAVSRAGARTPERRIAFGVDRWDRNDFLLRGTEMDSCCFEPFEEAGDQWGEFMIAKRDDGLQVEFRLTIIEGAVGTGDTELNLDDLRQLLQARRKIGRMLVTLHTDSIATTGDLLPALMMCSSSDAAVILGAEEPQHVDAGSTRTEPQLAYWMPSRPSIFRRTAVTYSIPNTSAIPSLQSPAWFPAQFLMSTRISYRDL